MKTFATSIVAFLAAGVSAHMEMKEPTPLGSQFNPNTVSPDFNLKSPLDPSGSTFPCGGKLNLLGTPAGKSVVTYAPGSSSQVTILGDAAHNGGSCQISLSVDGGKTWKVIQSVMGNCPLNKVIPFTVPSDAPSGDAVLAWSWSNNTGNREYYMNCAAVTIGGGPKRSVEVEEEEEEEEEEDLAKRQGGFSSLPDIFVSNLGITSCKNAEGVDVRYPNPGPNPISNGAKLGDPTGDCGAKGVSQPNPGNGNANPAPAPAPSSTKPADAIVAPTRGAIFAPSPAPTFQTVTTSAAATTSAAPATTSAAAGNGNAEGGNKGGNGGSAPTTTSAAPAAKPTTGTGTNPGTANPGNVAGPAQAVGTKCAKEGIWNCIAGTSFQRCASGQWSPVMQLSAGMECAAGEGETINMKAISRPVRRYSPGRRVRWA